MPMLTFDSIPQARVVRKGGRNFAPPRAPRIHEEPGPIMRQLRDAAAVAMGMWPLTAVLLLAVGFLVMAGNGASP